jgi:signal transduction histidine kinase
MKRLIILLLAELTKMRCAALFTFVILSSFEANAQNTTIDSLRIRLLSQQKDTAALRTMDQLVNLFFELDDCDSALRYSELAVKLAVELSRKKDEAIGKFHKGISLRCKEDYAKSYLVLNESKKLFAELNDELYVARCIRQMGLVFSDQDHSSDALDNFFSALSLSEKMMDTTEVMRNLLSISELFRANDKPEKALEYAKKYEVYAYSREDLQPRDMITQRLGFIYKDLGNDSLSLHYQLESLHLSEMQHDTLGIGNSYIDLGYLYAEAKDYGKSLQYLGDAEKMYRKISNTGRVARAFYLRAQTYESMNEPQLALKEYFESLRLSKSLDDRNHVADNIVAIGNVYLTLKQYLNAQEYFQNYLTLAILLKQPDRRVEAYEYLSQVSEKLNKPQESLRYLNQFIELRDSIDESNDEERLIEVEATKNFERVVQENKMQQAKEQYDARIKIYSLLSGLVFLFLLSILLFRNIRQKQKAKIKIEKAFDELKATQAQLIQSEKMASLGQLTAGIAHEIQNPLNFVNNFSEVSNEMLNEINAEIEKGNFAEVKTLTTDVRKNLEKILHHGKRADSIVKGMLQHSRTSSGVKEPTDINVLADEYLRLAFHGFRAKDKSFNVTTKTEFDETVGKIPVVPQDIGRVVLNLITNAFYTVSEKKKQSGGEYEPTVTLRTKRNSDHVLISVKDNGNGISPKVQDRIFQPFFTTKPTGQGTGLGLSLSYDIVKAHRGELVVETREKEGSEFIISLPVTG